MFILFFFNLTERRGEKEKEGCQAMLWANGQSYWAYRLRSKVSAEFALAGLSPRGSTRDKCSAS